MARPVRTDDEIHARARLRTLAVPPSTSPPPPRVDPAAEESAWGDPATEESAWGGPAEVEVGGRTGWPTAAPGTPAARLRISPGGQPPEPPRSWSDRDPWPAGDDGPGDDPPRGSAWDAPDGRAGRWAARWVPASWRGARWDPGRTGALALAAVAAVAAVVAAVGVWSDRPVPEMMPALPVVAGAAPGAPAAGPPVDGPIVVSVSGKVTRPGLVRLPPGSRVGEAIDAAGGAEPAVDLTGLNLAARLTDGEQVVVGMPAPVTPSPAASGDAGGAASGGQAPGGKVNLNTATLEQLDQLPGVGPVTAQRLLDWRTQNGRFASVDQIQEVSGIGDARYATLRELVTV